MSKGPNKGKEIFRPNTRLVSVFLFQSKLNPASNHPIKATFYLLKCKEYKLDCVCVCVMGILNPYYLKSK